MQLVCCLEKVGSWWLAPGPQNPGGSRTPPPPRAGPCGCQAPGACYLLQGLGSRFRRPRPLHEASEHVNGVVGRPRLSALAALGAGGELGSRPFLKGTVFFTSQTQEAGAAHGPGLAVASLSRAAGPTASRPSVLSFLSMTRGALGPSSLQCGVLTS